MFLLITCINKHTLDLLGKTVWKLVSLVSSYIFSVATRNYNCGSDLQLALYFMGQPGTLQITPRARSGPISQWSRHTEHSVQSPPPVKVRHSSEVQSHSCVVMPSLQGVTLNQPQSTEVFKNKLMKNFGILLSQLANSHSVAKGDCSGSGCGGAYLETRGTAREPSWSGPHLPHWGLGTLTQRQ